MGLAMRSPREEPAGIPLAPPGSAQQKLFISYQIGDAAGRREPFWTQKVYLHQAGKPNGGAGVGLEQLLLPPSLFSSPPRSCGRVGCGRAWRSLQPAFSCYGSVTTHPLLAQRGRAHLARHRSWDGEAGGRMSREGEEREHRGQEPARAFFLGVDTLARRMLGEGLGAPAPEVPDPGASPGARAAKTWGRSAVRGL